MTFTAGILIVGAIAAFALIFPERTIARFARTAGELGRERDLIISTVIATDFPQRTSDEVRKFQDQRHRSAGA